uniref:Carboxypeptidase n=1 Tax=Aegilops tauschii TaxID=37682 RepID=M8CD93_AEGTA
MKSTVVALLLLVAVQCLALGPGTTAAAKPRRTRQGDYLNRLRGEQLRPFRVMSDGKTLYRNPYSPTPGTTRRTCCSWRARRGWGTRTRTRRRTNGRSGDNRTAEDAYLFLANWMERFPEYKGREFYITGESYAGHYVPQLAHAILRHASPAINLKGIMIGNAVINDWTDSKGMYDFFWTHALISDETAAGINKNCNFTAAGAGAAPSALCYDASDEASESLRDIDIYNIYAPNCQSEKLVTPPIAPSRRFLRRDLRGGVVRGTGARLGVQRIYSDVLTRWVDSAKTVLPIIRELMKNNIRVWVYSGDTDGRVPVTSSRLSVNQLQLPVAAKWRPWVSSTKGAGEVGGYIVQYKGDLSLVTVRGAGHEVPSYQPRQALVLVQNFLTGKALPDCKECEQD